MANPEHLAILKEGVAAWNQWREENPAVQPDFEGANLIGPSISEADLGKTRLGATIFSDTTLTRATGLDTCRHIGPSSIDMQTLRKSWPLPLSFLRGCGLDDAFIEYLPGLVGQPIEFYSCFISYSTKDQAFAERLHADLQAKGVRCWFAPEDIQSGKKIHDQVVDAIRLHDKLLLILSEHSMQSNWVKEEIRRARRRERRDDRQMLFPVRLIDYETLLEWELFDADEGRDLAAELREYFIPDFSRWKDHDAYSETLERLLRDLKTEKA